MMRPLIAWFTALVAVQPLSAQWPPHAPLADRYSWWAHRDNPDILLLYRGDTLVGVLDPDATSWRWTPDGKTHDLLSLLYGPGARDRGRNRGHAAPEHPAKAVARTAAPVPPASSKLPAADDAAVSNPESAPKAGIREESEDGTVTDVIDGSPRNQDFRLGGVDLSKLAATPRYRIGEREVGAAEALSAISAGTVPDDSTHVRLTVIGAQAVCEQVRRDLESSPDLAFWKGRLVVNCYRPDYWRVRDGGFVTPRDPSQPVIYVQQADGKVLWRQDDYAGGAEALARALRDKVPGYDPNKDPSPKKPNPPAPTPAPANSGLNPWWLAVPAGLFLGLYAAARRKVVKPA